MEEYQPLSTHCPFISHMLAGCRVNVITSQTIPSILECCGDRYVECPLYSNELACADSRINRIQNNKEGVSP